MHAYRRLATYSIRTHSHIFKTFHLSHNHILYLSHDTLTYTHTHTGGTPHPELKKLDVTAVSSGKGHIVFGILSLRLVTLILVT
jgi:hypothetical protein